MSSLEQDLLARLDADRDRSIEFLRNLLRVPSPNPPGDTRAAAAFLQSALREAGLESEMFSPHPEMPNIVSGFAAAIRAPSRAQRAHRRLSGRGRRMEPGNPGVGRSSTAASMAAAPAI